MNNKEEFMTIVYLIRHSVRMNQNVIISNNTKQSEVIQYEKIILSVEGEKKASLLSKEEELQNLDVIYVSNCVRTLQTAKYFLESQNLNVTIDDRLDERRKGISNDKLFPDWFERQYLDENFKTEGGESRKEVTKRISECFYEIIKKHKGKRIAIFSHGYAITFFLLKFCKLQNINDRRLTYKFKDKLVFDKIINAPEVFKLTINEQDEIIDIELIEFDNIPFNHGV